MSQLHSIIRILCVVISLSLVASIPAASVEASPLAKKSSIRKAKQKRAKKRARKRAKKKVTYKKILKWWRAGTSNKKILRRAKKARYVPSKKDIRRLKKKGVSKKLISRLKDGKLKTKKGKTQAKRQFVQRRPKKIDIKTVYSEDEMDFDSVPPPSGMPTWTQEKKAPAKKTLDRSLRPSAPFKKRAAVASSEG